MTATITKIDPTFTAGSATYHLHCLTSTVTNGTLDTVANMWWFASVGGTVIARHEGYEWTHTALTDGERVDLLIVDEAGEEQWATPVTLAVGAVFTLRIYVNATTGDDSTGDGSSGAPYETLPRALTDIRSHGGGAGAEFMIELSDEAHAHGAVTGGYVWNQNTLAAGGGSAVLGRVSCRAAGDNCVVSVPGSGVGVCNNVVDGAGVASLGVHWLGDYVTGGSAVTGIAFQNARVTDAGDGLHCTIAGGSVTGFWSAVEIAAPSGSATWQDVNIGVFDWMCLQDVEFGDSNAYHVFFSQVRYAGVHRATFLDLTGAGSGSSFRSGTIKRMSMGECEFDRSGSPSWTGNVWRINGGSGRTDMECDFVSVFGVHIHDCSEGFELESVTTAVDYDGPRTGRIRFFGCIVDLDDVGNDFYPWKVTSAVNETFQVEMLQLVCCAGMSERHGMTLLRMENHAGGATTNQVYKVRLVQCTSYQPGAYGGFGYTPLLFECTGINYQDDCFTFLGNYGYCAEVATDFSHPVCFIGMSDVTAADKVEASDYNIMAKFANSADMNWLRQGPTSRAVWNGATGFDANSDSLINQAAHGLTNVTSGSFDPRPSGGSGLMSGNGAPLAVYGDLDRGLFDTSTPDAGAFQFSPSGSVPDPDFGGGGGGATSTQRPRLSLSLRL